MKKYLWILLLPLLPIMPFLMAIGLFKPKSSKNERLVV